MKSCMVYRMSRLPMTLSNFLWSFSPASELRIISRRHVDRRQVLSTVDRRLSLVDHTQRPALSTARWRLGVTQGVARSVGVKHDLPQVRRQICNAVSVHVWWEVFNVSVCKIVNYCSSRVWLINASAYRPLSTYWPIIAYATAANN